MVNVSFAQMLYITPEEDMFFTFCLVLSGVVEATQSPTWVNVTSGSDSAMGKFKVQQDTFDSIFPTW